MSKNITLKLMKSNIVLLIRNIVRKRGLIISRQFKIFVEKELGKEGIK